METSFSDLVIHPTFATCIKVLKDEERARLRENILSDGEVLDHVLWWRRDGVPTVVDGHSRIGVRNELLEQGHDIPEPRIKELTFFSTDEEVVEWIETHHAGRRHYTSAQLKQICEKYAPKAKEDAKERQSRSGGPKSGFSRKKSGSAVTAEPVSQSNGGSSRKAPDAAETVQDLVEKETGIRPSRSMAREAVGASKPPKAPVDKAGKGIPGSLLVTFQSRKKFSEILWHVSAVLKGVKELVSLAGGERISLPAVDVAAKDLRSAIRAGMPHAVCPHCKGRGCKPCDELGWMHKDRWDGIPEERKK